MDMSSASVESAAHPRSGLGAYVVFLILVGATIPWRGKTYFDGGADPVVLAKAALSLGAAGLAVLVTRGRPVRDLPAFPTMFLGLFLLCTLLGGWAAGDLVPSAVIVVRVAILAMTVVVLMRGFEGSFLLSSLIGALGTFALSSLIGALGTLAAIGAVTDLADFSGGRLSGEFPPLHPNELASTCALIVLWVLARVVRAEDTWFHLVVLVVAMAVLLATGSRTPLGALAISALVLFTHFQAVRRRTFSIALLLTPMGLWLALGTNVLVDLLVRGDTSAQLTTLSNRTIAWRAALAPKDSAWLEWLGGGLTMKRIDVSGQWWNQQILDSSWISALIQGGIVGAAICVVWMMRSLLHVLAAPRASRALQLAILVYLPVRGVLESGLFDATTSFLVFFTAVMSVAYASAPQGVTPGRSTTI